MGIFVFVAGLLGVSFIVFILMTYPSTGSGRTGEYTYNLGLDGS